MRMMKQHTTRSTLDATSHTRYGVLLAKAAAKLMALCRFAHAAQHRLAVSPVAIRFRQARQQRGGKIAVVNQVVPEPPPVN